MASSLPSCDKRGADAVAREEPRRRNDAAAGSCDGGGSGSPWLSAAGLLYLTFSSAMALHRSWPDPAAAAFVASAYVDLILLFCCLRRYERTEPGSPLRHWLKLAVWLLTSALTLLFSFRVAAVMPAAVAAVVYTMALATVCGGFVAFFCLDEKPCSQARPAAPSLSSDGRPAGMLLERAIVDVRGRCHLSLKTGRRTDIVCPSNPSSEEAVKHNGISRHPMFVSVCGLV